MAAGDQLLENLAQHLRIDRDLDVEGRGLHDGEVELVEELREDFRDALVGDEGDAGPPVEDVFLEESAVEERRRPRMIDSMKLRL